MAASLLAASCTDAGHLGAIMDNQSGSACWGVTLKAMLAFALLATVTFALGVA